MAGNREFWGKIIGKAGASEGARVLVLRQPDSFPFKLYINFSPIGTLIYLDLSSHGNEFVTNAYSLIADLPFPQPSQNMRRRPAAISNKRLISLLNILAQRVIREQAYELLRERLA